LETIPLAPWPLALPWGIGYLFGMTGPIKSVGSHVEDQTRAAECYTRKLGFVLRRGDVEAECERLESLDVAITMPATPLPWGDVRQVR
jgi:hypothetical protein